MSSFANFVLRVLFFCHKPLPGKESNRLFIWRKKMCNLYYNSRHCSNLQSSPWFHYYTGLQLHIPCDKSFVQFLLLSAIHSSFLRSGAQVWGNQLYYLGNLQELFCLNIDSKRLLARRKTYKKYFWIKKLCAEATKLQGHPMTFCCKITVRKRECYLEISKAR